jgi:hypothetical protein
MAEEHWQPARLIPTSGINGVEEAERRATSALMAVMGAVPEFGHALIKPLGSPAGKISTYIEVPFKINEQTCYPDGLVETARGSKRWTTLVEVKTGSSELERPQIESYLDVAREQAFDAVVTISNQLAPAPGIHPVEVDKRKLRKVTLHHLSWAEVLTVAVQQCVHRGVSDPDQAWILGELIRYLEHPKSGALDFADMGAAWVPVREAVAMGTLRANDKGLPEVVSRWEQLLRFAALRLGRELGAEVQVALSRREIADPTIRFASQAQSLVRTATLTGSIRIPDAVAPLDVTADLRGSRITVSIDVDAPREGRAATRINWLTRQLKEAPGGLRIDAFTANARTSTSELLKDVRENPLLLVADPKKEFRTFRIAAASPMGTKRGTGRGGFIDSVLSAVDGFYEAVAQEITPWAAKAPQLPRGGRTAVEEAGLDIQPPPLDEFDEEVPEEVVEPPEEELRNDLAAAASRGATQVRAAVLGTDVATSDAHVDAPLLTWDVAQDRLDNERREESDSNYSD